MCVNKSILKKYCPLYILGVRCKTDITKYYSLKNIDQYKLKQKLQLQTFADAEKTN